MIKKLTVTGFKSLEIKDVPLERFNVLMGPNAAGKSNILKSLKLLRDAIVFSGFAEAVARNGGTEQIRSMLGDDIPICYELEFVPPKEPVPWVKGVIPLWFKYKITVLLSDDGSHRILAEDLYWRYSQGPNRKGKRIEKQIFSRNEREIILFEDALTTPVPSELKISITDELIGSPFISRNFISIPTNLASQYLQRIRVYNIDLISAQSVSRGAYSDELNEDGSNLGRVLMEIKLHESDLAAGLKEFLTVTVPESTGFDVEQIRGAGTELVTYLIEEAGSRRFYPSSVSDGTVRLVCYFLALMYHKRPVPVVCFEEPENSIHPYLLETMVDLITYHPDDIQVLITTHSKVLADLLKPENVFLVSKHEGKTTVLKASTSVEITTFCERYGIGEAWMRGLVGAKP